MSTDTAMKIRGLTETLESALAGAAACFRQLAALDAFSDKYRGFLAEAASHLDAVARDASKEIAQQARRHDGAPEWDGLGEVI